MIEDKKDGIKIAADPMEALVLSTIKNTEERLRQAKLELEINEVVLKYLKERKPLNI
jgi:hypothetical protein